MTNKELQEILKQWPDDSIITMSARELAFRLLYADGVITLDDDKCIVIEAKNA